ncbi:MAG: PDZ domain-containing protein [Acidobacteriaceae bacterium]
MVHFSRLVVASAVSSLLAAGSAYAAPAQRAVAPNAQAQSAQFTQGYLGVVCSDVTNDQASTLKLKQAAGAQVLNVDRDAPAGKAGLRPHDVILQMNGQNIAGEEMLRRMLRETPAGHTITLLISRAGRQQTMKVTLADRTLLEQEAWSQPMIIPAPDDDDTYMLEGPSGHSFGSGFFGMLALGSPSVGVELDALGPQLADYFGIKDGQGLLVKRVAEDSPASRAGLKAGDVITRANGQKMATLGEWMKMLHANRGKNIPINLIRNRQQQTVTLQTAANHKRHSLLAPDRLPLLDSSPGYNSPGAGTAWISYRPN